ncbi:TIGR03085 family protein [Corynebacterium kutscheri]|uniref:TIGR03085 family protein n=1 Tax=Corynebacterium kutscheri TaxID=35755 RepID=A0A0F6R0Q4_9CORY|nr:TIGR03085 family metal-binding protein [Corynebacterium kutscheri]AKE41425.1 TIGR03085 family protein [Corynebacterium kutscheri]VEH08702.1 Uncharacterised protein [Corynebacterium kutscheri]VEH09749.1 Uncharacterised protein [Corynebacterium kutscheri]
MSLSVTERAGLADTLRLLGPAAPTLCEGWNAHDLLVHLYVRENNRLAALGMFVPMLSARYHAACAQAKACDFAELVEKWAAGSPVGDKWINAAEHFVHHEDLLRGGSCWQPRQFSRTDELELLQLVRRSAKMLLRGTNTPVVCEPVGYPRFVAYDRRGVADKGDAVVILRGHIGEILLWLFGRKAAEVEVLGNTEELKLSSV